MEIDPLEELSLKRKAESLRSLCTGHFESSITKLANTSRRIPSGKDFHYYFNFDEFRAPVDLIGENSQAMLESAGTSSHIWAKEMAYPGDLDDAYDWLVNINDEVFERLDVSMDEFTAGRKGDEKGSGRSVYLDTGFQLVYGKKKKGTMVGEKPLSLDSGSRHNGVTVTSGDKKHFLSKPRIPFHIPTIPRPQKTFNILVNNANEPFQHVWLSRSEDGMRFVHPLENHSALDFVETNSGCIQSGKPGLMSSTPFKLVQEVKDLKKLAAKLANVNEFAVDLEHNQYRSFQGLTCLMQVSTRSEDFIIDTLKLRIHVGPYLREVFKDPKKKKVMHGADRDILWLQRDFGIYVCNLFDTGQASRVLKLERNSLEHLLYHYCEVTANKEYQNADWRLRPLPPEMLRYAREDTHYLLHIYDLMRIQLLGMNAGSENTDEPIVEVYSRSYDICMQLYEKDLLTDTSYLNIYGLQNAHFSAQQLAVVSGLCQWRDFVARSEDESTGYILPNKTLLEIAKHMPNTAGKLRDIIKANHYYAEQHLGAIVSIIRNSLRNASAFELAMKHHEDTHKDSLRGVQLETNVNGALVLEHPTVSKNMAASTGVPEGIRTSASRPVSDEVLKHGECETQGDACSTGHHSVAEVNVGKCGSESSNFETGMTGSSKAAQVIVQKLDKPTHAFGAFFGTKSGAIKNVQHLEDEKLQQVKSSVALPFYSFCGSNKEAVPTEATTPISETPGSGYESEHAPLSATTDVMPLDTLPDVQKSENGDSEELDEEQQPMSLSDLVSGFQQCIPSRHKNKPVENGQKGRHTPRTRQFVFDYERASGQIKFGENEVGIAGEKLGSASRSDGGMKKMLQGLEQCGVPPQGRRRLAFPSSGNRSATFH